MNFFKEQQVARERLIRFKILFFSTLILANYLFSYIAFIIIYPRIDYVMDDVFIHFFDNHLDHASFWMSFICFTLFAIGCAQERVRRIALGGGQYVAERVGGKEIPLGTINIKQLRLKNIVEEMSIASGIIPPKIYILENENEINAFAAGFTINDAVVGISNGCLEKLTREELQGVIAHEIGHIVNGDMKLNLELIAYLKEFFPNLKQLKKDADEINIFFKCFYLLIGSPIVFLWKLAYFLQVMLKQAVTRNQEFIADAKAVQLTRNPDGIAGALKKILVRGNSFSVASDNAQEFFHLWLHWPQSRIFSSHPPLEERIAKILPGFDHSQFVLKRKKESSINNGRRFF